MLYSIFQQILNMSLTASAVIAVVLLLRPLFRRTPRALTYLLWAAVLFRLVCPVSFSADFALLFGFGTVNNRIQYLPTDLVRDSLPAALNTHAAQTAAPSVPIEAYTPYDLLGLAVMVGAWVWLAGIFVFLLVNAVSLVRLRRRCVGAVHLTENVYLADRIAVPFVLGVIFPKIYLPATLSETERDCILRHEHAHIRRGDPLLKLIAFLALAMHWFNPLVWVAFHAFVRDMETACDERVLRGADKGTRADYAETLLRLSAGQRAPRVPIAFSEGSPKARIKRILRYKKPAVWATAFAALCAVLLGIFLLANPRADTMPLGDAIEEFPRISNGSNVELRTNGASTVLSGDDAADAVFRFLQNLLVANDPIDKSRAEDRDKTYTVVLNSGTEVHFSDDFSTVWVDNHVKPSYTYAVESPGLIRNLFQADSLLSVAISARQVENLTVLYCPKADDQGGSIHVGELPGTLVSDFLLNADWTETVKPWETLSSPESVEFVIQDDLRVQIWKSPHVAAVKKGTAIADAVQYFRTNSGDYEAVVALLTENAK
ncbi:MAG: M56 family metallopeptidase [Ruminococcus bromii]|nr:M56 family metallopeptidase [Ruminococcus bromii]